MRTLTLRRSLASAVLLLGSACATGGSAGSEASPSSSRAVITLAELPTTGTETAYDAINRLRPEFLRPHPAQSYSLQPSTGVSSGNAPPPALIVNGQRAGEVADLRQVAATSLQSVRYYTIEQAKRKFGMQYEGGAIEISYR
jgi:ABC-type glycerol-3-phosphate transport system substrate-binding protein